MRLSKPCCSVILATVAIAVCAIGCAPRQLADGVPYVTARHKVTDAKVQRVKGYPCLRVDDVALDRLDQVVGEMERDVADADIQRYFLLDLDFEERVMEACPNKKLVAIWRNLGRPILRFRYFSLYPPGRLSTSLQYHRDLVLAFRRRDGVTADQLVQRTIEAAGRALRAKRGAELVGKRLAVQAEDRIDVAHLRRANINLERLGGMGRGDEHGHKASDERPRRSLAAKQFIALVAGAP